MTATLASFITNTQVAAAATDIVTTAAGESKFIGQLTFTNTSASAVLVTVYKILTSATETAGSGGNWIAKRTVQPGKVWNVIADIGNVVLAESETLSAIAGTAAVVNVNCAGVIEA